MTIRHFVFFGLFQFHVLHFAHRFGNPVESGSHLWPHLAHTQTLALTIGIGNPIHHWDNGRKYPLTPLVYFVLDANYTDGAYLVLDRRYHR